MAFYGSSSELGLARIKIIILAAIILLGLFAVFFALNSARTSAANKNRLADIAQIHSALEIFYDQNGYYPYGSPIPERIGDYLNFWPLPPGPAGACSAISDIYSYAQKSSGSDYAVTFCLSKKTSGLSAGMHTLTPKQIQ